MLNQPDRNYSTDPLKLILNSFRPLFEREKERVERQNYRASKKGLPATLTVWQWLRILERWQWRCAFCKGPFETMEHVVRLADGAGTTAGNVVPCCTACNQQRGKYAQQEQQIKQELAQMSG